MLVTTRINGHTLIPSLLGSTSIAVDLGANTGAFSTAIVRRFGCRLLAVEANPDLAQKLNGFSEFETLHCAVGDRNGQMSFALSRDSECSSLLVDQVAVVDRQVIVEVKTLTALFNHIGSERIDLVKMDIEGAEVSVIDSAPDDVLRRINQLTLEFHDFNGMVDPVEVQKIISRFHDIGFDHLRSTRRFYEDTLFINRDWVNLRKTTIWYAKYCERYLAGVSRIIKRRFSSPRRNELST